MGFRGSGFGVWASGSDLAFLTGFFKIELFEQAQGSPKVGEHAGVRAVGVWGVGCSGQAYFEVLRGHGTAWEVLGVVWYGLWDSPGRLWDKLGWGALRGPESRLFPRLCALWDKPGRLENRLGQSGDRPGWGLGGKSGWVDGRRLGSGGWGWGGGARAPRPPLVFSSRFGQFAATQSLPQTLSEVA